MPDFRQILNDLGAIWRHDPQNPGKPHAILTNGRHTNGFANLSMLGTYPDILAEYCSRLTNKIALHLGSTTEIEWIVGPAMGGITVAHEIAKALDARCAYAEKQGDRMVLARSRIPPGKHVLVCEDVLTTGGTAMRTVSELESLGCIVIPAIATLVSRTAASSIRSPSGSAFQIIRLTDVVFGEWDVPNGETCALCAIGSPALRPKEHWNAFFALD